MNQLPTPEFFDFVSRNVREHPDRLRLRFHNASEPWISYAITHIECLQKCGRKFGELQPRLMLSALSVEQATSEAVARLHGRLAADLMPHGGHMLDMTCGMGIDLRAIYEATSAEAIAFDMNPDIAFAGQINFEDNKHVTVNCGDSVAWLKGREVGKPCFDLVFIDPARRDARGARVFNLHDCAPDVTALIPLLEAHASKAMVKLSPMLDLTQTLRDLPAATSFHIVEERGECRELLALLDFTSPVSAEPQISVDRCISPRESSSFTFTIAEEQSHPCTFAFPSAGEYLFEPGPAAMKAQPFATLCARHGLKKLHPNTHLFTAPAPVENLPGTWHRISTVEEFSSSGSKRFASMTLQADVAVRNFPLTAAELQKKLKIKSGGSLRLYGVTAGDSNASSRRLILFTEK